MLEGAHIMAEAANAGGVPPQGANVAFRGASEMTVEKTQHVQIRKEFPESWIFHLFNSSLGLVSARLLFFPVFCVVPSLSLLCLVFCT